MLKPKFMAACFVQFFGFVTGAVLFIVLLIASSYWLVFIASLPIIGSLMYFPSTPSLYIITGSAMISVYPAMIVCKKICDKSGFKYNIAMSVLGFSVLAYSIYAAWVETLYRGLSFDVIFGYLNMAGLAVLLGKNIIANKEVEI